MYVCIYLLKLGKPQISGHTYFHNFILYLAQNNRIKLED